PSQSLLLCSAVAPPALRSFPTRRSSDLKPGVEVPTAEQLLAVFESVRTAQVTAYEDAVADAPLVPRVPEPAAIVEESTIPEIGVDRKSTRLNSSHVKISYAVFCLKKKKR